MTLPSHGLLLGLGDNDHPQYALSSEAGVPSGTRMVFDQDAAPVGWTRDVATINDRVIRIVTGARADGGTWTQPGHSHSGPSHVHAGPSHTHTGPSHQHTNPSVDSDGAHTHSVDAHTHSIATHSHTIPDHAHSNQDTDTSPTTAIGLEGAGSSFEYTVKTHTHAQGQTGLKTGLGATLGGTVVTGQSAPNTDSQGAHQHTQGSSGFAGTGVTGGGGTADTGSGGTGATGGSATVNTWRPLHRDMIVAVKD